MKIICIWENKKLKSDKDAKNGKPVFYFKPETCLLINNKPFFYPEYTSDLVCSLNAVIKICTAGKYIQKRFANSYYDEIATGFSLTAADIQKTCIKNKHPLSASFSFDGSAPVSQTLKVDTYNKLNDIKFQMKINGKMINSFQIKELRFSFDDIISHISEYIMLKTGDIIFAGHAFEPVEIQIGDIIEGFINDDKQITVRIK